MVSTQRIGRIRLCVLAVSLVACLQVFAAFATAGQIIQEYTFERPTIDNILIDAHTYDHIVMKDAPNGGQIGQPSLPARGATILLPPGSRVESVNITTGQRISLGDGYMVAPVVTPYPLSLGPEAVPPPQPDPTIYESSAPFPSNRFESLNTQSFRGYRMAIIKLRPVEYVPATGELYYYTSLTVSVNTTDDDIPSANYRGLATDRDAALAIIDNPAQVDAYPPVMSRAAQAYDMLILTYPTLAAGFQPLKDYHDTTGILTEIHTTDDVGSLDPDAIRDYIRSEYLTNGIQYVLIGACDRVIPAKDLYVQSSDGPDPFVEENMPTDMYFGCLDGTFNYDGDEYWGEPTDGDGGGDVDLVAEVYVGRAAVLTPTDITNFVNKTIGYLESSQPYLENVLLAGEHLTFGGWGEYGGYSMDQLIDGSDADGYSTVGIPSTVYSIDKLYDLTWPNNDWPNSAVLSRINSGLHIVNHYGHCNFFWAMKTHKAILPGNLTNDDHCFVYSQGCMAGQFDGFGVGTPQEEYDCWAEVMTIKQAHGAFAAIMNARYGFGAFGTDGPAHRYNREFWDAVFNPAEGYPEIGRANQDSKEDNLYRIDESCMRWTTYELTLFGDPTIPLQSHGSVAFDYPDGVPETVPAAQEYSFTVAVRGICGGTPVSGSGQLHYSINGGGEVTVPMTETAADTYSAVLPALECGDVIEFSVSAEEASLGRVYHPVMISAYSAFPVTNVDTLFTDDFESDNGWTISGGLWARGVPTGQGGETQQYGTPDPTEGCAGENVMGYNLNGDYENSIGEYHVTSPAIDCSGRNNVFLEFSRWLGVESPVSDHAYVRVSNDGTNWTTVWQNGSNIGDNLWVDMDLDISAVADDQPTVYLRWTMGPTNFEEPYCGWNIDDVLVVSHNCRPGCCGQYTGGHTGNTNCDEDGKRNLADISRLIDRVYLTKTELCCEENGNVNGDIEGKVNLADISRLIDHVYLTKDETAACP